MKQLLFCYKINRKLFVRKTIITDVFVPVQDIVSPQKSTLIIPKTNDVQLNDIVIIRDNNSGNTEYIGYIETLSNKVNTEISCYPLINVFDNDYVLDKMFKTSTNNDGTNVNIDIDVAEWLKTQLERAFVKTDDDLQALPLIVRNKTNKPILYKSILETSNLLEVYLDLFVETGLFVVFSGLKYNLNVIEGIYCDIYCNTDEKAYNFRYDNPLIQKVDIVDNTFTNYNKIIATEELADDVVEVREPKRFYFYLLNDNSITTNPNDERRIKQVRSKEITFSLDENKSDEENAKALLLYIHNELQAPEYNLQITIDMFNNEKIKLYKRVDFVAESGIMYSSNITKIEKLNDKQVRITLGALRNSLTDFKKKMEAI